MASRRDTMLVCEADPVCLCSCEPFDCMCSKPAGATLCAECEARLIRIVVDSGERVA